MSQTIAAALGAAAQATPPPPPAAEPHAETAFLPRMFDLFARPVIWLNGAGIVLASGFFVGFGLSGVAAAMVIWAGAMAQGGLGLSASRKTSVMVISMGVTLIVAASAHNPKGVVSAILTGGAVFAGTSIIMMGSRGKSRRPGRDPAARAAYRRYWEQKIRAELGDERWRERRRRRARSDPTGEG